MKDRHKSLEQFYCGWEGSGVLRTEVASLLIMFGDASASLGRSQLTFYLLSLPEKLSDRASIIGSSAEVV